MATNRHWDESIAATFAKESGVFLSERHWEVLGVYRDLYFSKNRHPMTRIFVKALNTKSSASTMLELMQLFGERPLYTLSFIAGLPKPPHCI